MKKNTSLYILLIFLFMIFTFLSKKILSIDDLILSNVAEKLTEQQLSKFINLKNKLDWVNYVFYVILILIKVSLIAIIIDIGCFLFNKKIAYNVIFKIVLKAEYIFLLVIVCKTIWFYAFQTDYTIEDFQYFYPLSAINITGYDALHSWFIYPLQVISLFEIAYWFILAYLIGKELNISTDKGLGIVASSYGVGLLIWVVTIMFLTLNVS